ncbi:MAG: hypothetical protein Q4C96_10065 [Planctomycetia bacterium]|nr:hypothetical protein [Planctomycetia bacterium]
MNLVGKIFVVLIFVLSLVLMTISINVYMTHTNWRFKVDNSDPSKGELGLTQQLEAMRTENEELRSRYASFEDRVEKEREEKRTALAKLQTELNNQVEENAQLRTQIDELTALQTNHSQVARTAQEQAEALLKENEGVRGQIAALLENRDSEVKKNVQLRDQYNNQVRKVEELEKRSAALSQELAAAKRTMEYLNILPDVTYYMAKTPPLGVIGRVTDVNNDQKIVEISLGSDDGVREGHSFEIQDASGRAYIGRIILTNVYPDRSVGSPISGFENGVIARGNRAVPVKYELGK